MISESQLETSRAHFASVAELEQLQRHIHAFGTVWPMRDFLREYHIFNISSVIHMSDGWVATVLVHEGTALQQSMLVHFICAVAIGEFYSTQYKPTESRPIAMDVRQQAIIRRNCRPFPCGEHSELPPALSKRGYFTTLASSL